MIYYIFSCSSIILKKRIDLYKNRVSTLIELGEEIANSPGGCVKVISKENPDPLESGVKFLTYF